MKDCRDCRSYKDCVGKPWYHYGEIRWCPYQVVWIIESLEVLATGGWPPNPEGTGYIDPKIKTGYASEAYYVKPVGILAEVEYRLRRVGIHGKLLKAEVLAGLDLSDESRSALMYVKGWRRKRMGFRTWAKERRYRTRQETGESKSISGEQRISRRISSAISNSLGRGGKGGVHWETIVGYTRAKLIQRLESQFRNGMSWQNYGEWHIDHIVPINHFHFNSVDDAQFKECWALKNLQPLWASDNIKKSNKYGRLTNV